MDRRGFFGMLTASVGAIVAARQEPILHEGAFSWRERDDLVLYRPWPQLGDEVTIEGVPGVHKVTG